MSKIFGIVLIFAAAWLMFRLQTGNGSSSGENNDGSEPLQRQNSCQNVSSQDALDDGKASEQDKEKKLPL